jgi:hypothetical protein
MPRSALEIRELSRQVIDGEAGEARRLGMSEPVRQMAPCAGAHVGFAARGHRQWRHQRVILRIPVRWRKRILDLFERVRARTTRQALRLPVVRIRLAFLANAVRPLRRLERRGGLTLLECRPITGRRHQIRVHLSASGWPIVGDRIYGEPEAGFPRHALHAWRTTFAHPFSGKRLAIEAAVPAEIRRLLYSTEG